MFNTVTAGGAPAAPAVRAIFDKARQAVPLPSPWPARFGVSRAGDPTLLVEARGLKPQAEVAPLAAAGSCRA